MVIDNTQAFEEEQDFRRFIKLANSIDYQAHCFSLLRALASSCSLLISFEGAYKYYPATEQPKILCSIPFVVAHCPIARDTMRRHGVFDATILEAQLGTLEKASITNGRLNNGQLQFKKKYLPGPFGVYNEALIDYLATEREKGHYVGEWSYVSSKTGKPFKGDFELRAVLSE